MLRWVFLHTLHIHTHNYKLTYIPGTYIYVEPGGAVQSADSRDVGECIVVDAAPAWIIIHVFVLLHFIQISYRAVFTFCPIPVSICNSQSQSAPETWRTDRGPQEMLMNVQLYTYVCRKQMFGVGIGQPFFKTGPNRVVCCISTTVGEYLYSAPFRQSISLMKTNNSGVW